MSLSPKPSRCSTTALKSRPTIIHSAVCGRICAGKFGKVIAPCAVCSPIRGSTPRSSIYAAAFRRAGSRCASTTLAMPAATPICPLDCQDTAAFMTGSIYPIQRCLGQATCPHQNPHWKSCSSAILRLSPCRLNGPARFGVRRWATGSIPCLWQSIPMLGPI